MLTSEGTDLLKTNLKTGRKLFCMIMVRIIN